MRKNSLAGVLALSLLLLGLAPLPSQAAVVVNAGSDAAGPDVLAYSNDRYTDEDQEDLDITNALLSISKTVSVFDGGAGDRASWEAALAGIEVLVIPEGSPWQAGDTVEGFNSAAKSYVLDWVRAGRTVIGTGSYTHLQMITDWAGVSFLGVGNSTVPSSWSLQVARPGLPTYVPKANYTGGMTNYSSLSQSQKDAMEVIYFDAASDNVGVASFEVGSGFYIYNAYDWYPGNPDLTNGTRAAWNQTLQFGATGAITGVSTTATTQSETVQEAPRYQGPLFESGPQVGERGSEVTYQGRRLDQITSAEISGSKLVLTISPESISFVVPSGLAPGSYDIVFFSPNGKLTFMSALVVKRTLVIEKTIQRTLLLSRTASPQEIRDQLRRVGALGSSKLSGGTESKLHCLVNSSDAVTRIRVSELCELLDSALGASVSVTSTRESYLGEDIWIRIWMRAKFTVEG